MANITIRNIPDELLSKIKTIATTERRSLNNEIIRSLEKTYERKWTERSQFERLQNLKENWLVDDDFYNSVYKAISSRTYGRDINFDE